MASLIGKRILRAQSMLVALVMSFSFARGANNHVVIIAGKGGTTEYTAKFGRYAQHLHDALTSTYGFAPGQITLLTEAGSGLTCTAANVEATFVKLANILKAGDLLIVVLFGHGAADANYAKLNLVGTDLRDLDFARLLEHLPGQQQVFINTTAASAGFIEKLARKDRVVITATRSAEEKYVTVFPEYFVEALVKGEEVDLNRDQKISLLEAFDYARDRAVRFYEQANRLRPEHPLLEDNGDGIGSEIPVANAFVTEIGAAPADGALAARIFLTPGEATVASPETVTRLNSPLEPRKAKLLAAIESLKTQKQSMPVHEYERKLEELFIALARLNREIKQSTP